jgi:hypothetical protein
VSAAGDAAGAQLRDVLVLSSARDCGDFDGEGGQENKRRSVMNADLDGKFKLTTLMKDARKRNRWLWTVALFDPKTQRRVRESGETKRKRDAEAAIEQAVKTFEAGSR